MSGTCKSCIFTEVCHEKVKYCNNYYPIDDDRFYDEEIERSKDEFYKQWFTYIGEYDDDIFF